MRLPRLIRCVLAALCIASVFTMIDIFQEWKVPEVYLEIAIEASVDSIAQLYYDVGYGLNEKDSSTHMLRKKILETFRFPLPRGQIRYLRFDPLDGEGSFSLRHIHLFDELDGVIRTIDLKSVKPLDQIGEMKSGNGALTIETTAKADDPKLYLDLEYPLEYRPTRYIAANQKVILRHFLLVFVLSFTAMLFTIINRKESTHTLSHQDMISYQMIMNFVDFIRLLFVQRHLILSLAKREIAAQYVGSLLGFVWTFINPIMMILVFWVVFGIGFKAQPMGNVPFVVWLTAGMASWFIFSDIITGSAGVIVSNSHLVKKTIFHSEMLPVVKIVACLVTHLIFLLILVGLIVFHKLPISFWYLQFFYYLFGMLVLSLGLSWAVAALNVFIRDVGQIVGVILNVGFWATPILWDINIMPWGLQTVLKLNPMFYIVQGYRDSFVSFSPFWEHPYLTAYFWFVAIVMFVGGALVFKKLKPQFADVL